MTNASAPPEAHSAATSKTSTPTANNPTRHPGGVGMMLRLFFFFSRYATWFPALVRPLAIRGTILFSGVIREGTRANARRIFGRELLRAERAAFTRAVVGHFYDFVVDMGRGVDAAGWQQRVANVVGQTAYRKRRGRGGVMLVTLHMGSFEAGLSALRQVEDDVSVVFLRDRFADFESMRRRLRQDLGVTELALDDGLAAMAGIPAALRRGGAVVMQGDRAYPGQKSVDVPLLGGHLRIPTGPVRLAASTGCPIVPVASVRRDDGRFDVHLVEPIDVIDQDDAIARIAGAFETFVREHPTQWLVLRPAFVEDQRA